MKFTKEDAYKHLVGKISREGQTLNISERSINEMLDTLIPLLANDETELDAFIDNVLPAFKTADANIKNDVSHGINKYKEENPVKKTVADPTKTKEDDVNAKLLERLEALERKSQEAEQALKIKNTKQTLSSKMKELGVDNEKWIDAILDNVNITENFDIDTTAKNYLELYNSMSSNIEVNVTPKGTGGGKHDYISDSIAAAANLAKQQTL